MALVTENIDMPPLPRSENEPVSHSFPSPKCGVIESGRAMLGDGENWIGSSFYELSVKERGMSPKMSTERTERSGKERGSGKYWARKNCEL